MKRNLRKAFAFILALTMVVSLFACGKKDANPDGGDSSSDDTFTIAYIGPLTGEASAWGTPEANTLKLLVDQVNAEGGIAGKKVILNTYDNRGDNVETTNAAKKAIEVGGADVIVGCNSSGASLALASVCEEYKVPSVATCATNSKVTEDDNGNVREWTFRVCLADPALGNVMAKYDRKFRNFWGSTKAVRQLSDTICVENGLSIVENPKPHGKSYNKWLGDQAKPSHRELLRVAIDNALSQSPANFEELLKLLQESGCEVSKRGKSYRLKLPGWEKAARMDSLGEGYGLDDLQAVLSGKKTHTPRKKIVTQAETQKVNLLVDIQAKLQAGKGAGYARWAKVFNLKQMAQTMNYLSENNLLEYAVLEEKAAAATAHHNELSAQIKAAEKRMAEIAVLRTHIVNYAKTREVYVAYRKAGYSKKFREEHEEEILLHQAAKNAFDEMGVKKLPKVKELQTEYAKLLEEKKKTYTEYRRSREEMRELLTAKANVDRVLKMEVEQDVEKEKDHGQR